ncbi:MAG: hypothetical protein NT135_02160 [Candidatus Berkelbacteria bacterium]|nr:hypothetical protein [Candidatus Berkelbacteria bacterium]
MAHFQNIPDLFFTAYKIHNMKTDEGENWLLKKLEQSYTKIMPQAKKIIKPKYDALKILLG